MSTYVNGSDFCNLSRIDMSDTDRVVLAGRRGTGKTTSIKKAIADGLTAVWLVQSAKTLQQTLSAFVPQHLRNVLPDVEDVSSGDFPDFKFGDGSVIMIPKTFIVKARDTGVYCRGSIPRIIVSDEIIRTDGRYAFATEPEMIDDLAFTIGRTGEVPKIICAGNPAFPPNENNNPYSIAWNIDMLGEGVYTDKMGRKTMVLGTADCKDCFGERVGIDAETRTWSKHLSSGGQTFEVNGKFIRIVPICGGLYVGTARSGEICAVINGRYTPEAYAPAVCKFILECRTYHRKMLVVYDSFEAQLLFFALIKDRV